MYWSGPPATRYKCRRPVPGVEIAAVLFGRKYRQIAWPSKQTPSLDDNLIPVLGLVLKG